MNVVELLYMLLCASIGWSVGVVAEHRFGLAGFVVGFSAGVVILPVAIRHFVKYRRGPFWPWF